MSRRITILTFVFSFTLSANAQWTGPIDSTTNILLKNRYVEIEATQAINDMYNFQFDKARRQFNYLKKQYGWHPLPYFLQGLNLWWRMLPYGTGETKWDDDFLAYMDTSLYLSERLYNEVSQIEGAFFLAATYSFIGRLHSERSNWTKAALAGKNSLKYLEECRGNEDFSPEILFGDALFNYYEPWIKENYPILKPIMAFFPEGDKELGIEQLEKTARNAFYSRTEAQYFLMRILYYENGDIQGALQIAEYLHKVYPMNAYFHRFYARLLYQGRRYNDAIAESKLIIERIDLGEEGYEYNSGRYAAFFLAHINEMRGDLEESEKYYKWALEYGELADATDMGYYHYSMLHLGRIAERKENYDDALEYYKRVKKLTKRSSSANEEAREKINTLRKKV